MKKIRIHQAWEFWKHENENGKLTVNLPHDAMIMETRIPEMDNGSSSVYFPGRGNIIIEKTLLEKRI